MTPTRPKPSKTRHPAHVIKLRAEISPEGWHIQAEGAAGATVTRCEPPTSRIGRALETLALDLGTRT